MDILREKIAERIIVNCGYDTEYPCPHAYPILGYEKCPHEDKDICMWQLEQADEIINVIFELAKESPTGTFTFDSHIINIY